MHFIYNVIMTLTPHTDFNKHYYVTLLGDGGMGRMLWCLLCKRPVKSTLNIFKNKKSRNNRINLLFRNM